MGYLFDERRREAITELPGTTSNQHGGSFPRPKSRSISHWRIAYRKPRHAMRRCSKAYHVVDESALTPPLPAKEISGLFSLRLAAAATVCRRARYPVQGRSFVHNAFSQIIAATEEPGFISWKITQPSRSISRCPNPIHVPHDCVSARSGANKSS